MFVLAGVPRVGVGCSGGEGCFVFPREAAVEYPSVLDGFGDCFGHRAGGRMVALNDTDEYGYNI